MTIDPELKKRFEKTYADYRSIPSGLTDCWKISDRAARFLLAELEQIKAEGRNSMWRLREFEERINQFLTLCTEAQK